MHPRSVYVRRWLLLLAAAILVAWVVVQVMAAGSDEPNPTSTADRDGAAADGHAHADPDDRRPPRASPRRVTLAAGTAAVRDARRDHLAVRHEPAVRAAAGLRRRRHHDVGQEALLFTPKPLDPLAVITHDDDTVWDSSICETAIVSRPVRLVPGWATTVRVPWVPRESGDECKPDEDWIEPGEYTLRVGTLGR